MKKLLIFDLDGTLLNTLTDLTNAVNFALDKYHYESKSEEYVRKAIGNGVAILISRCLENGMDNPFYTDCLNTFREYYRKHYLDNTKPYENMRKALMDLKKYGYKLAVVTNKIDSIAKELINHYFKGLFEMIQGDTKTLEKKPSPDMVNHVLEKLSINREDACYIGDTNIDYDTAYNSKMDVLLVTYGYRTREELKNLYDVDMVNTPLEISEYFKNTTRK